MKVFMSKHLNVGFPAALLEQLVAKGDHWDWELKRRHFQPREDEIFRNMQETRGEGARAYLPSFPLSHRNKDCPHLGERAAANPLGYQCRTGFSVKEKEEPFGKFFRIPTVNTSYFLHLITTHLTNSHIMILLWFFNWSRFKWETILKNLKLWVNSHKSALAYPTLSLIYIHMILMVHELQQLEDCM